MTSGTSQSGDRPETGTPEFIEVPGGRHPEPLREAVVGTASRRMRQFPFVSELQQGAAREGSGTRGEPATRVS